MIHGFTEEDMSNFFKMVDSLKKCRRANLSDIANNDDSIIEKLYVDPLENDLVLTKCLAPNTTILIGRKGTGKSTIIARLQHELRKKNEVLSLYLDVKTIYDQSKSLKFDSEQYSNVLSGEELQRYLLFKTFLREIIEEIKKEVKTNTVKFYLRKILKIFGPDKSKFYEELNGIYNEVDDQKYEDISLIREQITSTSHNTQQAEVHQTDAAIGAGASQYGATIEANVGTKHSGEISCEEKIDSKFSEILLKYYNPRTILTKIKDLLQKIGIKYVFICLDDFSEIDEDAMKIFVDAIIAPLNNWSDEYFKFKIAAYPDRVYYGDIDPTKIDQIKLDYYDLYASSTVRSVEDEAINNIERLLTLRCDYFCKSNPEYFFDTSKEDIRVYYKLLFDITSNVPRNIGWILWYAHQYSIAKDRKISIKDLEISAERYYVNSIEVFFSQNKYMKESFDEKLEKYHLNELLNQIIAAAKENKTEITTLTSAIFSAHKDKPVTSHFFIDKQFEFLLSTLELNFFVTKYNEQKNREKDRIAIFSLNYGLCNKEDIYYGKGNDRKYVIQRRFDYSRILKNYIDSAKEIKCSSCRTSFPIDMLDNLKLFGMLCPECRKGTCEVLNIEVELPNINSDIQLKEFDIKLLNALKIEEPQFASLLAQELDCSYQKVTKRVMALQADDLGLIEIKHETHHEEYGPRSYYYLTDKSKELYFN